MRAIQVSSEQNAPADFLHLASVTCAAPDVERLARQHFPKQPGLVHIEDFHWRKLHGDSGLIFEIHCWMSWLPTALLSPEMVLPTMLRWFFNLCSHPVLSAKFSSSSAAANYLALAICMGPSPKCFLPALLKSRHRQPFQLSHGQKRAHDKLLMFVAPPLLILCLPAFNKVLRVLRGILKSATADFFSPASTR